MKNRIVSFVLAVCMIVGLCSVLGTSASAYSTGYPNTHQNTGNQREDVVAIAKTQLGYTYDNGTKYGAWWGQNIGASYNYTTEAWCAMFILWCENQAGCTTAYNTSSALTTAMLSYYRSGLNGNAAYAFSSGYVPRAGDVVFVAYNNAGIDHVGLITEVTDTTIYTVEGNYSDKVMSVTYDRSSGQRIGGLKHILYYGAPNYAGDTTSPVIETPQSPAAESGTPVSYNVLITADTLNIRDLPSTSSTVLGTLAMGDAAAIAAEETDESGTLWGQLASGGWICLAYTKKDSAEAPAEEAVSPYQVRVTCDILTIRSGAGTSNSQIGSLRTDDVVTIVASQTAGGLDWGKTESGGWIALKYTEPVAAAPAEPETTASETAAPETAAPETQSPADAYDVVVTCDVLTIREGAGLSNARIGSLYSGDTVTIVSTASSDGLDWGELQSGGWIALGYTQTVFSEGGAVSDSVSYDVTVTASLLNVRSAPVSGDVIATLSRGDSASIVAEQSAGGAVWGECSTGGWICLSYTEKQSAAETPAAPETPAESAQPDSGSSGTSGTVTASVLNIRDNPVTGSIVGTYQSGASVTILETSEADGQTWGRTADGWISMAYVSTGSAASGAKTVTITGSVVNVRSAAGTSGDIVSTVTYGTTCTILSETEADGLLWGELSTGGWICLQYAS